MRAFILVAAAALLALAGYTGYLMFFDERAEGPAATVRAFPLHLLLVSIAAGVLLALGIRAGGWPGATTAVIAALAGTTAAVTALVPTVALVRAASEMGAPVSLATYLRYGASVNSGDPATERSVTYATVDGVELRLDVWQAQVPGTRPAVVLLHGGGWREGHRGSTPEWNRWLTRQGYDVFDADYRLIGDVPEGTAWRASVRDAKCAVAWVASQAGRYDVDPDRITVMGRSAGAHLAMMAAYTQDDPQFSPSCELPMPRVSAVVEMFGRADLALFGDGDDATARASVAALTGGTPDDHPDRYAAASPVSHVTRDTPPTLILTGRSDHLVPIGQARALEAALAANDVPHRARYFPLTDHDYDRNWGGLATQASRIEVQDFLVEYG